ncbi:PREDICTED: diacylglycerol kinase eta-like isoform X1 [Branchiostoma belcheri]|uniref:Diacylglycerol kinase n=1 Tax=Branchiostoma belcheri TaxID=7741 RepID=A0A6P4ZUQ8_BRABE|nr:PREDICTED: diacylglycerol kinase eta-like isoform X1 [Branchiostoma belcheri]
MAGVSGSLSDSNSSVSVSHQASLKEGWLMKQTNSFQRMKKRYFKLKGRKLYYAKEAKSLLFDEIDLTDVSVAECSTKNVNNSFQVITPFRRLILSAENRKEMEEWMAVLRAVQNREFYDPSSENMDQFNGMHNWYTCSHARPTYCNVCREALSGVMSTGLSCEVCKFKAHKRCATRAPNACKWTALSSIGQDTIEDDEGIHMPHQWLEGNLPVSAKCSVCDHTCGSVLRLQDWKCLWCRAMVHTTCKEIFPRKCPLGDCRLSIVPPTALNSIDSDGFWVATRPTSSNPLLVFVNSKSGDNQGVKFLRRFKQLLNPAQVFDLMNGGPHLGLRLFQRFDLFRILVCGGDGSVGWVLSEIDKLNLHKQCQMGVLPLGTGNDLARVLGWGAACDDDTQLPAILWQLERATCKMLDRWSIMTCETKVPGAADSTVSTQQAEQDEMTAYELQDSVATHLSRILQSDQHSEVIQSARVLCETVKHFVTKVGTAYNTEEERSEGDKDSITHKCKVLDEKLNSLLTTLNEEAQAKPLPAVSSAVQQEELVSGSPQDTVPEGLTAPSSSRIFKPREQLMSRANSLKKAVRSIIEHTERAVDEQNAQTKEHKEEASSGPPTSPPTTSAAIAPTKPPFVFTVAPDEPSSPLAPLATMENSSPESTEEGPVAGATSVQPASPIVFSTSEVSEEARERSDTVCSLRSPPPPRYPYYSGYTGLRGRLQVSDKEALAQERRVSKGSTLSQGMPDTSKSLQNIDRATSRQAVSQLPGIRSSIASSIAGGCLVSKVLLANADALCAAASPLMDPETASLPFVLYREGYREKCVMNNYFGIGLDAKITLEFHNKREEHPVKFRSRTRNFMWYGMLGGREILQRTYRSLEQRIQLECDGQRIPLPSLQGIVVLNIPSFGGGANFWGGVKEDDNFVAPSFDDKVLEVVAVFSSTQMAFSRVMNLQHHRIVQCRTIKITIQGSESVPVQVDGEAWMQPPGYIRIVHKNRAQMLTRDRAFEKTLMSWTDKQKFEKMIQGPLISNEETAVLAPFVDASVALIRCIRVLHTHHRDQVQELIPVFMQTSTCVDKVYSQGRLADLVTKKEAADMITSTACLYGGVGQVIGSIDNMDEDLERKLVHALNLVDQELRRVEQVPSLAAMALQGSAASPVEYASPPAPSRPQHSRSAGHVSALLGLPVQPSDEEYQSDYGTSPVPKQRTKSSGKFGLVRKLRKSKTKDKEREKEREESSMKESVGSMSGVSTNIPVFQWGPEEVGGWLESLALGEYRDSFMKNDIRGAELLALERRDLKDLGVRKVGHVKRILQAVKDLQIR